MLAAEVAAPLKGVWQLAGTKLHRLVVWTFRRSPQNAACWFPRQVGHTAGRALARRHRVLLAAMQGWWRGSATPASCANHAPIMHVQLVLETPTEAVLTEWLQRIQAAIAQQTRRQGSSHWRRAGLAA
jgi:hypothetical protein